MSNQFDKRNYISACRRIPAIIDIERLKDEVSNLPEEAWRNDRARVHRNTESIFLKGAPPLLGISEDNEQPLLMACPYIRELMYGVVSGVPGKCLLAALNPNSVVYPHTDAVNEYFVRSFRIHIPVFTNENVRVYCGGGFFTFSEGEVWSLNNLAPHAVINDDSVQKRIHLIFDIFPDTTGIAQIASQPEIKPEKNALLFERLAVSANSLLSERSQN